MSSACFVRPKKPRRYSIYGDGKQKSRESSCKNQSRERICSLGSFKRICGVRQFSRASSEAQNKIYKWFCRRAQFSRKSSHSSCCLRVFIHVAVQRGILGFNTSHTFWVWGQRCSQRTVTYCITLWDHAEPSSPVSVKFNWSFLGSEELFFDSLFLIKCWTTERKKYNNASNISAHSVSNNLQRLQYKSKYISNTYNIK